MQFLACWMLLGSFSLMDLIKSDANSQHKLWTEYRLQFDLAEYAERHHIEPLPWQGSRVVGQRFEPVQPAKAVVHIVHGYLDHTGIQEPLIKVLTENGFTVRTIDLPGHGVSQGARAEIASMQDYSSALDLWLKGQKEPLRIVGHSMGGAVVMEGMRRGRIKSSDHVVLIAPLVRWSSWRLSAVGEFLLGWMIDSVPRGRKRTSDDLDFQRRRELDPLRPERIPLNWVRSMRRWAHQFEQETALYHRPTVLQGRRDRVVDWQANYRSIQKVFPQAAFHFFKNGRHHLQGESPTLRQKVFAMILERFVEGY